MNICISKQICDKCGLNPKLIQDYELNDIEIYIDFENNHNFVKLLELPIKGRESLGYILWHRDYNYYDVQTFLKSVLEYLQEPKNDYVEEIKQAIKKAKWEI